MRGLFFLFLAALFFSCSLKYEENSAVQDVSPELEFRAADYRKYEDSSLSTLVQAEILEQYKDNKAYGKNVHFSMWNSTGGLVSEGNCSLIEADSSAEVYTLFNGIIIDNFEQNFRIEADSLKWNGKSRRMMSTQNGSVSLARDGAKIQGSGFSADGVTRDFVFENPVSGVIETDDSAEDSDGADSNEN
ncbi:hypothetical protein [Treponema sp.]|uniref:hypothetical protein n=1 Tax=Treponema sp. TaxID=166 RepID=UPI003EFE2147